MLFLLIFKSMLTYEVIDFVMEECLPCLLVFCLFPMVYVMLVSCYTFFFESRNMKDVLYLKERSLCVLSYDICLLSHDMAK